MGAPASATATIKVVVIHQGQLRISFSVDHWPAVNEVVTLPVAASHRLIFNSPKLKKYLGKPVKLTGTAAGPGSTKGIEYRNFAFEEVA